MSFPRYPKYKASGVEWLGDVPVGWEVDRIKRSILTSKNGVWGAEPQQDESDIPCVRVADFDRQRLRVELSDPTIRNVVESERVGRVLCKGDLLLEKAGGGDLQPVGCVVLYDDERPAVCSNFVARVQVAPGMHASYWRYVHAAAYAVRLNTRSIKQTSGIQNLDGSQYFDERAAFPPLDEQTAIAEFLDQETGKIDALVAEQRRLMELLKEKRQAVISHAVTKGLNPHAPMKPSGIEWLGDVPEHWAVVSLRYLFEIKAGGDLKDEFFSNEKSEEHPYPIYTNSIKSGEVYGFTSKRLFKANTITVTGRGDIGYATYRDHEYDAIIRLLVLTPKSRAPCQYFAYFINSMIRFLGGNTAVSQLSAEQISPYKVFSPTLAEQQSIVAFLDTETAKFDTLTVEAQRAIDLLQERRTALISASVTGQIDVRQPPKN